MDQLVPILVYISLGLVGLGMLVIAVFGVKSLISGKVAPLKLVLIGFPIVLAGILALVYGPGNRAEGVIVAFLITLVVAFLALLASGVRGIFS